MVSYCIKICHGKKCVFACDGLRSSYIAIDENKITAEELLQIFSKNEVLPAHIKCVYEDLVY